VSLANLTIHRDPAIVSSAKAAALRLLGDRADG
jgi:hypothetical protein